MSDPRPSLTDDELLSELIRRRSRTRSILPLGCLLAQARQHHPGLSPTVAARKLRKQLRKKVLNSLSSELLIAWEEQQAEPEPWLLGEYLELLEVPLPLWLDVLRSLAARSKDHPQVHLKAMHTLAMRSPIEDEAAVLKVLRGWMRNTMERIALEVQMESLAKAALEAFDSEVAA